MICPLYKSAHLANPDSWVNKQIEGRLTALECDQSRCKWFNVEWDRCIISATYEELVIMREGVVRLAKSSK